MIGIGIDTGGTCTDAVVYDVEKKKILACGKSQTTHEKLEIGIGNSVSKLPRKYVEQADYISLSTTLATNACVEGKGGRAALVFVGVDQRTVQNTYEKYGFENMDNMIFLDGDAKRGAEPEWSSFEKLVRDTFDVWDSVAVAQIYPKENNGAYEKQVERIVKAHYDVPVICAYELFSDVNVIQRGSSALLNARLISVIREFLEAVKTVLREQRIELPLVIMRSDGSLMSEEFALYHPVETLLCGPAASVKGGAELAEQKNALIIDMGGTTSDIAFIKDGQPMRATDGVQVGSWRTFVKGLFVDTFGLGGDSQVCYNGEHLYLGERRVIPLSQLAHQYSRIVDYLKKLSNRLHGHSKPLHEHLVLMKDISGNNKFSKEEQQLCENLKGNPLPLEEAAAGIGRDLYNVDFERLEREGVILRSGLTPTDIMCIKGDLAMYDSEAAACALKFLAITLKKDPGILADQIYDLVKEKLYCNLVRILLEDYYRGKGKYAYTESLDRLVHESYRMKVKRMQPQKDDMTGGSMDEGVPFDNFFMADFHTDAALIGVGAPTHVFLPDVAKLLGAPCVIPEYAGVTNALGALLGDICVYDNLHIEAIYEMIDHLQDSGGLAEETGGEGQVEKSDKDSDDDREDGFGFRVYAQECPRIFTEYADAVAYAKEQLYVRAEKKAYERGAVEICGAEYEIDESRPELNYGSVFMGADVRIRLLGRIHK